MTAPSPPGDRDKADAPRVPSPIDFEQPTAAVVRAAPSNPAIMGKPLGDFDLVREIGRGGMGVVYEARQRSLKRQVALKILPPGLGITAESVQRFEREAQTAAKLHHTNIVPVYAIGAEEGNYFYAMELVDGQSLSEILSELKGGRTSPLMEATVTQITGPAPVRKEAEHRADSSSIISESSGGGRAWFDAAAKLLADVADALHYAHSRGVIHRDIKPSNLMLSRDGRLCVTDFGLARVTEEPGMTVTGSFLGTPAYMSPEQIAAGRITVDHRTDIYSLGAVLYEMLTFQRPFPGESRDEVLTGVMTREPGAPRKINPRVPQDLETICTKAMEKDPARRYATAADLANDLRQHLNRGLIAARRASPIRRAAKFVRRNPVPVTIAIALVMILAISGGVTGILSAQKATEAALRGVADARYFLSQGQYADGLKAIDGTLRISHDLGEARLLKARLLMKLNRAREAVEQAQAVLAKNPDDWTAHLVLAMAARDARGEVQQMQIDAGEHLRFVEEKAPETADAFYLRALVASSARDAITLLNRALALDPAHSEALTERIYRRETLKDYPSALQDAERLSAIKPRSAEGHRLAGWIRSLQHDRQGAFAEFEQAIRINPGDPVTYRYRAELHGAMGEHAKRLADLDRAVDLAPDYAPSLTQRGRARRELGKLAEAEQDAKRALEIDPNQIDAYWLLYFVYRSEGKPEELESVMARTRAAAASWADSAGKAGLHAGMAQGYMESGNLPQALASLDTAIALRPNEVGYPAMRGQVFRYMGNQVAMEADCRRCAEIEVSEPEKLAERGMSLEFGCGRRDLAIRDLSRAIELAPAWAEPRDYRATLYRMDRRWDDAIADYTRAIEVAPRWGHLYNNRAIVYGRTDRNQEAFADYSRCVELGDDSRIVRSNRALTLVKLGRPEEALAEAGRVAEMYPDKNYADRMRAETLRMLGRTEEALRAFDAAVKKESTDVQALAGRAGLLALTADGCQKALADLDRIRRLSPRFDPEVMSQAGSVLSYFVARSCPDRFDPRVALAMTEQSSRVSPDNSVFLLRYGVSLYRAGQFGPAAAVLQRCVDTYDGLPPSTAYFALAMSYQRSGERAKARSSYERGLERLKRTYPLDPILTVFRDEAAGVLGIGSPS